MSPRITAESLHASWQHLCSSLGFDAAQADNAYAELVQRYGEPHRHYHTLEHIAQLLLTIARLRDHIQDLPTVELAIWFHDAIYDPQANDNEAKSAALARTVLANLGLKEDGIARVEALILCTQHHVAADADSQALLDADLAVLGAPDAEYDRYAEAIRKEYSWVPADAYRSGRWAVLQRFLERARIFQTQSMFEVLEDQARRNLHREIESLQ